MLLSSDKVLLCCRAFQHVISGEEVLMSGALPINTPLCVIIS